MIADKKGQINICTWKGTKNLITEPKLYHNTSRIPNARKSVQKQRYKPLQSIYYLMHGLEQVPKGVMRKQAEGKWQ